MKGYANGKRQARTSQIEVGDMQQKKVKVFDKIWSQTFHSCYEKWNNDNYQETGVSYSFLWALYNELLALQDIW